MSFIFVEIYSCFESSLTSWLAVECISKAYVPFIRFFVSLALSAFSRLFALFFGHVRCVQNAKPNRKLHKGFHIHIYIRLLHIIFFLLLFAVGWAYSHHIVSILTKITIAICFVMCCAGVLWIKSIYVFALGQSNIFWLLFGRKLLAKFVLAS